MSGKQEAMSDDVSGYWPAIRWCPREALRSWDAAACLHPGTPNRQANWDDEANDASSDPFASQKQNLFRAPNDSGR